MRNNSNKNNKPKTTARIPAARQGAETNTSLAQRREKAVIQLPEERRKGTKYQVIRGKYLRQADKKEPTDSTNAAAIKMTAEKQEVQGKAKHQTMAAKTVKDEKEKSKISSAKNVSNESSDINEVNEAKNEYIKSVKAAEYTERLQTNIELNNAVNIPSAVTLEQTLDRSVQKDSAYFQDGTAVERSASCEEKADFPLDKMEKNAETGQSPIKHGEIADERAASYKEKADFYLDKMRKNAETGQKEINPNRDKDIGGLYKKAYKLARKEELIGKKTDTLFDKVQSAVRLKSEIDTAINEDNTGEAVVTAAAIPITHAATKAVRKLADKNKVINAGKTGFELAANVSAAVTSADGVGEATVNAVAAVPKYVVQKKVEKTVRQVIQLQHDRKIEAQRERLREKQEKVEKRAQAMKKEHMQRKMKADLYKSEHGIGANGNTLQRIKSALKTAANNMKKAIESVKSIKLLLFAGGSMLPIIGVILIIAVVVSLIVFPFFYISKSENEGKIEGSTFEETVLHYYEVMDNVVDDFNQNVIQALLNSRGKYDNTGVVNPAKYAQYESDYQSYQEQNDAYLYGDFDVYIDTYNTSDPPVEPEENYWYTEEELSAGGMERGPIFEGFVWDDETDGQAVPKGNLYDEMLCTVSNFNAKLMTRPDTFTEAPPDTEDTDVSDTETDNDGNSENETTSNAGGDVIFMTDETVAGAYEGAEFWKFTNWEEGVNCPNGGDCCTKTVTTTVTETDDDGNEHTHTETKDETYCPGHYVIKMKLVLDFDLNKVWEKYQFDDEDEKNYKEVKKDFDKEKGKAGIT